MSSPEPPTRGQVGDDRPASSAIALGERVIELAGDTLARRTRRQAPLESDLRVAASVVHTKILKLRARIPNRDVALRELHEAIRECARRIAQVESRTRR